MGLYAATYVVVALFLYATSESLTGSPWRTFAEIATFLFLLYPVVVVGGTFLGLFTIYGASNKSIRRRGFWAVGLSLTSMLAIVVGRAVL